MWYIAGYWTGFICVHSDAVTERNNPSAIGRDPFSRHDNPDQIQGICRGDRNRLADSHTAAHGAQGFHGNRQSKLLAQEAVYKPASAYFAASFEASQRHQEFAPTGQNRFT